MRTVASFKSDLSRKLHGQSLSKVDGVYDIIAEAGRNVLAKIDPHETARVATIENALFDDVYSYTAPSDIKGDKVIDLQPQVKRVKSQNYTKVLNEQFSRNKTRKTFNVQYKNGTKFLRISENVTPNKITVSTVSATTGWSVSTSAENLTLDELNFISGNAALNFDINTDNTTAIIENSTLTAVDLSARDDQNSLFVWLYIPTASKVTSITARLGSSSSNYYSKAVTTAHDSQAFADGWNLLRFDYDGATETGTTDWSAITYFQLRITHDQTGDTDFRLDAISAGVGELFEIHYYSDAIFKGTNGAYKSVPTLDTDTIQLETDAYNIMLYECAYLLAQELQGENGSFDESYFRRLLDGDNSKVGMYRKYTMSYPSQNKKARSTYYRLSTGNYR